MPEQDQKALLRRNALAARHLLRGDTRRDATAAVTDRAFERLAHAEGIIGLFQALHDELDPASLIERLAGAGLKLALPCTPKRGLPLVFRAFAPGDPLIPGRMNILEPSPDALEVFPTMLVVPPVAFDRRCYRIGYGAGFYDRTIPILRNMHAVTTLGIAFACQEVDMVPDEQHDVPLDAIATDRELILPGPN